MLDHLPIARLSTVKLAENHSADKTVQNAVTFIYRAKIAELSRNVTVTWSNNHNNYLFVINVENPSGENHYTCKIEMKTWQCWGKKGLKNFEVDGERVDVYWDFRHAKFETGPEPSSDYYVALVSQNEVILLLGDLENDAYKRVKKSESSTKATLLCKKENVYGKKLFCTRALVANQGKKEHDIIIETSLSNSDDTEMWISVDGNLEIRVMNLNWRFRGNETISVNNRTMQVFWDVHDWLFESSRSSHGLFIFKEVGTVGDGRNWTRGDLAGCRYDSPLHSYQSVSEFCHIVYAWKID